MLLGRVTDSRYLAPATVERAIIWVRVIPLLR
jgi:hypothetical protein